MARAEQNELTAQFMRFVVARMLRRWRANAIARYEAELPLIEAAKKLHTLQLHASMRLWRGWTLAKPTS